MSALRLATPTQPVRLIDLGPSCAAPLRGFSHHGSSVTGGSFVRPLSTLPAPRVMPTFCGLCGEQLPARRSPRGREQEWCSQACRSKASRDRRREA